MVALAADVVAANELRATLRLVEARGMVLDATMLLDAMRATLPRPFAPSLRDACVNCGLLHADADSAGLEEAMLSRALRELRLPPYFVCVDRQACVDRRGVRGVDDDLLAAVRAARTAPAGNVLARPRS